MKPLGGRDLCGHRRCWSRVWGPVRPGAPEKQIMGQTSVSAASHTASGECFCVRRSASRSAICTQEVCAFSVSFSSPRQKNRLRHEAGLVSVRSWSKRFDIIITCVSKFTAVLLRLERKQESLVELRVWRLCVQQPVWHAVWSQGCVELFSLPWIYPLFTNRKWLVVFLCHQDGLWSSAHAISLRSGVGVLSVFSQWSVPSTHSASYFPGCCSFAVRTNSFHHHITCWLLSFLFKCESPKPARCST